MTDDKYAPREVRIGQFQERGVFYGWKCVRHLGMRGVVECLDGQVRYFEPDQIRFIDREI